MVVVGIGDHDGKPVALLHLQRIRNAFPDNDLLFARLETLPGVILHIARQRAQALLLLNDMANRLAGNRNAVLTYVTGTANPLGAGMTCPTDTSSRQDIDALEWCQALQGAGEKLEGETNVGTLLGGRGCVEESPVGSGQFLITVAWQGLTPLSAPPASVACGAGEYDGAADSECVDDLCRRVVTTVVRVATL